MIRFTMGPLLKALGDGACDVVPGSLFHNLTVLGKNGQLSREGCGICNLC